MGGTIFLVVGVGQRTVILDFVVCTSLAVPVFLCCDYLDRFVEAVSPYLTQFKVDDGTVVPMVGLPLKRTP